LIASRDITTVVCLVLVDPEGAFLATQRPKHKRLGLFWEFPGGKVEKGESPMSALRREIQEELGIDIGALEPLPAVEHAYGFGSILLLPYRSSCGTRPVLQLTEHADACWIDLKNWASLKWAPADVPVIKNLLESKGDR